MPVITPRTPTRPPVRPSPVRPGALPGAGAVRYPKADILAKTSALAVRRLNERADRVGLAFDIPVEVMKALKQRVWRADQVYLWFQWLSQAWVNAVNYALNNAGNPRAIEITEQDVADQVTAYVLQNVYPTLNARTRLHYLPASPSRPRKESKSRVTRPGRQEPRTMPRIV